MKRRNGEIERKKQRRWKKNVEKKDEREENRENGKEKWDIEEVEMNKRGK